MTSGMSQLVSMAMFVQKIRFGTKLVRDGTVSEGDVMAVFWACLIAASNLQLCIFQFITIAKGKFAMVSLPSLINPSSEELKPSSPRLSQNLMTKPHLTAMPTTPKLNKWRDSQMRALRGIQPSRCFDEFNLFNFVVKSLHSLSLCRIIHVI
jgi:ATP-binding cassette, subfamily B (MDR/TAP), member 1